MDGEDVVQEALIEAYRKLDRPCEMPPMAFLDPRAFLGTNPQLTLTFETSHPIGMAGRSNMTPRVCCSRCTEVSHGTFERYGLKRAEAVLVCGEVFANRFLDVGAT